MGCSTATKTVGRLKTTYQQSEQRNESNSIVIPMEQDLAIHSSKLVCKDGPSRTTHDLSIAATSAIYDKGDEPSCNTSYDSKWWMSVVQ